MGRAVVGAEGRKDTVDVAAFADQSGVIDGRKGLRDLGAQRWRHCDELNF
jgi:hypothetical protein